MVLDKSIETLEDLVRFLNRKQSFYFKLYDKYLEGDYDRLDDSRKHEADCNAVCDDIVECIKAISDEAQVRGIAKKVKFLCTLDGQDEEKYILDEWLLKVVRLLDDKANWNRMLAPVEGKDMNNAFDAILFRLTYVANFLKELSTKTEQEYYGGRRTDVMPYYIGESKLKEHFFYAPPHNEEDEEDDTIIGYIAAVRDYQTQKTKYVDDEGNVCNNKSQAKVFDIKGKADNYSYEHCPEGWTHFVVAVKKSDILKEAEITKYMACCYDPEDYYEETNYIDEDGELSCNSSDAKLFNTEDEAIEYADEIKPIGWMSFAMPFNTTLNESDNTYEAKRLKEMTQAEFNRLAKRRDEFRSQTAISPAEKNNLYADIKDFEEEFRDLQDTAERLPDAYIDQVCDTASYPFDVAIDEVQNVEDWCSEAEEFLKDDINNWGVMKESKKRFKETALTSKSKDDKKSMWVAKIYNYDDSWDEYYIDENGEAVDYPDKAKVFDNEQDAEEWAEENRFYNWGAYASKLSESKKRFKETVDSTSAAFNLTKLKGYLRFETNWEYDEDYPEDAMLVDKVHEPPRFTVKWIGPKGKKHPNTYCVRTRRDRGESWDWETHYFLKASDAAEMINLEVGTWERNNESWKFESKEQLFNALPESIDDFPKNTHQMYRFAKQKHDDTGAVRKHSGDPYWVHPEGVAKVAAAYGGTDIEIQAAMAHDTLEDTNCSYDELEEMFGDEVASIVREITNDTEEVDRLGKEQYINLELISLSHPALFVKLCDMYYNQMDFPTEAQKRRIIKNINYLLANREDDLNENEIALIEDILQTLLY